MRKVIFPRRTGNVASLTGNAYCCSMATYKTRPSQRVRTRSASFRYNRLLLLSETTQVEFYAFRYFRYVDVSLVVRCNLHLRRIMQKRFAFNAVNFISRFIRDHPELRKFEIRFSFGPTRDSETIHLLTYRIVRAIIYIRKQKMLLR